MVGGTILVTQTMIILAGLDSHVNLGPSTNSFCQRHYHTRLLVIRVMSYTGLLQMLALFPGPHYESLGMRLCRHVSKVRARETSGERTVVCCANVNAMRR